VNFTSDWLLLFLEVQEVIEYNPMSERTIIKVGLADILMW
jgi:hypothetical protein